MPLLPLVLSIYFWRSTTRTPGKRTIFILLQDLFQVSFLMNLSMNSIPIKNRDALYYYFIFNSFLERCFKDMEAQMHFRQAFQA